MAKILSEIWQLDLGGQCQERSTRFKVWAPLQSSLAVQVVGNKRYPMERSTQGYFTCEAEGVGEKEHYFYLLENGQMRPDPVSRSLPNGVHGPTEIVNPQAFEWQEGGWEGIDLRECIFYEMHIGTFTKEGTFESALEKLDYLNALGINCIEIMPLAQFPGRWNWGYDGASLYAPFSGYGGVEGFKRFVNGCHQRGIAVCLDVVYNHLGPEGNYLAEFAPYFTANYRSPWGQAFNYDGPYSDEVRAYIFKNALYWYVEYHVDILRLDAIHGIYDFSASPMLLELSEEVVKAGQLLKRKIHLVAESDLNDSQVLRPQEEGGWNLSGIWNDDFHHAAHVALTKEQEGYYQDFNGIQDFSKALKQGNIYEGQYSAFRKRRHGNSFQGIPLDRYIVFLQNHDQIGNHFRSKRLSGLIGKERLKVAACMTLLTPAIPLLFMGEEYAERAHFEYFVDFDDPQTMEAVHDGRKRERGKNNLPYPGESSFRNSKLSWEIDHDLYSLYQQLIALRKKHLPKKKITAQDVYATHSIEEEWVAWEYLTEKGEWLALFCHLGEREHLIELPFRGKKLLLSTQKVDQGKGNVWKIPGECALVLI
jgi:maltooligosyltrehalose trehalohydrolase